MVIAVAGGVVLPTDINHGMALFKLSGISAADERRRGVCRQETEEVDRESLVGMEVTAGGRE